MPVREAATVSLLCGVALAEAVAGILPPSSHPASPRLTLKWPNDLLLNGQKLAGILLEIHGNASGGVDWVIPGIGLNLAHAPILPDRIAACLAEHMAPPAPEDFAPILLARLFHWCAVQAADGFAPIREAWLARAHPPGSAISLKLGAELLTGSFAGLDTDGSLLMATNGTVRRFTAGEVLLPQEA